MTEGTKMTPGHHINGSGSNGLRPLPHPVAIDAVLRATGILALMGIAVVHVVQLVPTFQATPLLGVSFVALIVGAVAVGTRLLSSRTSAMDLWLPVALLGAAAIGGYVFTRLVSTPLDNQDVGNWACMLGMGALFVEASLVGLSTFAMSGRLRRPASISNLPATVALEAEGILIPVRASGSEG